MENELQEIKNVNVVSLWRGHECPLDSSQPFQIRQSKSFQPIVCKSFCKCHVLGVLPCFRVSYAFISVTLSSSGCDGQWPWPKLRAFLRRVLGKPQDATPNASQNSTRKFENMQIIQKKKNANKSLWGKFEENNESRSCTVARSRKLNFAVKGLPVLFFMLWGPLPKM